MLQQVSETLAPVLRQTVELQLTPFFSAFQKSTEAMLQSQFAGIKVMAESIRRFARTFDEQWLPGFAKLAEAMRAHVLPENLKDVGGVTIDRVLSIAEIDGIALYGVPNAQISVRILNSQTTEARRRILGDEMTRIASDCATALSGVEDSRTASLAQMLILATRAAAAGHTEAAQALATNVLDASVSELLEVELHPLARAQRDRIGSRRLDELRLREALVVLPLAHAHAHFYRAKGDPVPREYSRHATVHTARSIQYSRRNTSQVLLLATSVILFVDQASHVTISATRAEERG